MFAGNTTLTKCVINVLDKLMNELHYSDQTKLSVKCVRSDFLWT